MNDLVGALIGIICGIAAGIPVSLLLLAILTRAERRQMTLTDPRQRFGNRAVQTGPAQFIVYASSAEAAQMRHQLQGKSERLLPSRPQLPDGRND